jgi:hypothetical protein
MMKLIGVVLIPTITKGLWGVVRALAAMLVANPAIAVIAALITALALAVDDLWAWFEGRPSLFGKWVESSKILIRFLRSIQNMLDAIGAHELAGKLSARIDEGEKVNTAARDERLGKNKKQKTPYLMISGKTMITQADMFPLSSMTNNSIEKFTTSQTGDKTFNFGKVDIKTQATDSKEIAANFAAEVSRAFSGLDNGVLA